MFNLKSEKETQAIQSVSGWSDFDVLMSSAKEKVLPSNIEISSSKQLRATDRLFNDVIDYLGVVGWSIYCGLYKEDDEEVKETRKKFHTVRPHANILARI